MASIEEVSRQVRGAVEQLPLQRVAAALDDLGAASAIVRETVAGSSTSEAVALADGFQSAARLVGDVQGLLRLVESKMQAYLDRLDAVGAAPPRSPRTASAAAQRPRAHAQPRWGKRLSAEEVAEVTGTLPPPVPKPNPEGKKTHGVWVDEHGKRHAAVSGRDDDSAEVWRQLQAAGMPSTREPAITNHVEAKLAAKMVNDRRRHVDVVINNRPCPGVLSCDALLPVLLPEGYSMTVHAPRYRKTFTGGRKWSN